MSRLDVFIDGASQGNPGPSGIGVVVCRDGAVVAEICQYLGEATNNFAEYSALLAGLEYGAGAGARELLVRSDSQLLCRQLSGEYKVRHPVIRLLYEKAKERIKDFSDVTIVHIPREENTAADRLATRAIEEHKRCGKRQQAGGYSSAHKRTGGKSGLQRAA